MNTAFDSSNQELKIGDFVRRIERDFREAKVGHIYKIKNIDDQGQIIITSIDDQYIDGTYKSECFTKTYNANNKDIDFNNFYFLYYENKILFSGTKEKVIDFIKQNLNKFYVSDLMILKAVSKIEININLIDLDNENKQFLIE